LRVWDEQELGDVLVREDTAGVFNHFLVAHAVIGFDLLCFGFGRGKRKMFRTSRSRMCSVWSTVLLGKKNGATMRTVLLLIFFGKKNTCF
jgi:hypothetical protein